MVTASVGTPAGSPFTCKTISTGMQLFINTAGEVVDPTRATTPVIPGTRDVAKPLASIDATLAADDDHVKGPSLSGGISVLPLKAWATNWWVCAMEKHDSTGGSTETEVIVGCTETATG